MNLIKSFMRTKLLVISLFLMPLVAVSGEVLITRVAAQQRHPGNGLVDITVTIQGAEGYANAAQCSFVATNSATKAAIPVAHVTRNGTVIGSGSVWTLKFIWDAKTDVGAVKIDDVALTVDTKPIGVQLWENGPYWAECNVGAAKPEEYGYYFWWGDTVGYKRNANNTDWISTANGLSRSFVERSCPTYYMTTYSLRSNGYIDSAGNLVAAHDAATAHRGAPWRMPTDAEFADLISKCDGTWTMRNGVRGWLVTGKEAYSTKSIFLPAAGYGEESELADPGSYGSYWSSTPSTSEFGAYYAWDIYFNSSDIYRNDGHLRFDGRSVRPVRGFVSERVVATGEAISHLTVDCRVLTSVIARQRYPWDGLVDIIVTLQGAADDMATIECSFAATNSVAKAAIPVTHVTRKGNDVGSDNVWTRKYVWDAKADVGSVKIDDVALSVDTKPIGVQLWANGPYWAECNVGATKPEECGYYFWWGDTVGYKRNASDNGWVSVKDETGFSFNSGNCPTYGKNESQLQSEGYIDSAGNLVAAHDAATAHLGAPWRMPTDVEFSELLSNFNCTTTWTTRNGVNGILVTGKGAYALKSIFLPAAGFGYGIWLYNLCWTSGCWSSTTSSGGSSNAWELYFSESNFYRDLCDRSYGQSVRPVRGFAGSAGEISFGVTTYLSLDCRGASDAEPIPELPENPTAEDVQSALAGSADSALLANVTDAATYNAYREWALNVGAAEVKASPCAWVSFATDSAALLAKMPTDDDLKVEEFKPSATAGSFDFTVSVKDVTIGDKASEDNLKKLFGLEGAESLDSAAFSSDNVALEFKEPQDGKLKFTATPAVDDAKSFFMKAKVK